MLKQITLLFLCFLSFNSFGQGLNLEKNQQQKLFNAGSVFEIVVNNEKEPVKECCNQTTLVGEIAAVTKDSIRFNLSAFSRSKTLEKTTVHQLFSMLDNPIPTAIARQDIFSLRNYKSLKSKKKRDNLAGAGALLAIAGIATSLNSLWIKPEHRKNLLIVGGSQFVLGITFGAIGTAKTYRFKDTERPWRIN